MSEKAFHVGQRVELPGKDTVGTVAYLGYTNFSNGKWVGVVLDEKKGKNNGSVEGKFYFQCEDGHGLFVRATQLSALEGGEAAAISPVTSGVPTPVADKSKSSVKRKNEPTSLRRKPIGNQVPQKPDRLRLPLVTNPKASTPRVGKEERTPVRDSSVQEMKKGPSFVEDVDLRGEVGGCTFTSGLQREMVEVGGGTKLSLSVAPETSASPLATASQAGFMENLTPKYTPGTPMGIQTLQEKLHNNQEIENLRNEVKDLTEKLETLKIKRSQDKDKLKEREKMKLQIEQLLEFKAKIMDAQAQLQKDLQKAKQEAKEAVEAKDRHFQETEELLESVEMLTLDKEMAEEKAEALQLEMEQMQEKIEEMSMDLEITKAEGNENNSKLLERVASVQVVQLEQQNGKLRETLMRMRDMAAGDKHELQKLQKEMEAKKSEILELSRSKESFANKVNELEDTIADLQEQVDAALGAEEMVETLTDRNLNLEERVAELLDTVSDLEAINDMNDQLQEDSRDLELELREELDMTNARLREVMKEKEACGEVILDRDKTIIKFRDLVQKMQEENLNLRNSLERETNKPLGTPSEVIDFKKMFSDTKAHSKAIDLELRRLEVHQANQHVNYLMQYLPETFINRGGDHDSVFVLLLLPRIVWKADIVIAKLREQYPQPEAITRSVVLKSHTIDQYSFACIMTQMFYMLQALVKQYHHILKTCTVEEFLKIGTFYPEMAFHEKTIDFFVDLLRKDQLDENVPLESLDKSVSYFEASFSSHLNGEKLDQTMFLVDVSKAISSAAEAVSIESATIETLLPPPEGSSEVTQLLTFLKSSCQEILNYTKRIKRRIPQDGSAGPISYPEDTQDTLMKAMSNMFKASRALRYVAHSSCQQTLLIGDAEGAIASDKVKEFIHQATDVIYGSEDLGPESLKVSLNKTQEDMFKVADVLEKGEFDFDGTQAMAVVPPLSIRAEAIKNELRDREHLKYKLENKEHDFKELKQTVKQKNEELSQMTVRRDMAEKKLSTANRDADLTIEKLQRKLDDTVMMLRRKEKEFEETFDQLQNDIESLECEKGELREKLKVLNKKTLYEVLSKSPLNTSGLSASSPTTPSFTGSFDQTVVRDSPLLLQQISDLKEALWRANRVNHSVANSEMRKRLASLKPLRFTRGNVELAAEEKRDLGKEEARGSEEKARRIHQLIELTGRLRKELMELIVGVEVVDLTKRGPGNSFCTEHLILRREKISSLKRKIEDVQDEVRRLVTETRPGGSVQTTLTTFPSPQFVKASAENLIRIGRVAVPRTSKSSEGVIPLILQPEHLKSLHLSLIS